MNREIRLAARPQGLPRASDFELVETPVPEPGEGEALIRNAFMSVDPYMRGRMNDVRSYVPPFELGEPLSGGAVGQVVESRLDGFAPGDWVLLDARLARVGGVGRDDAPEARPRGRSGLDGPRRARACPG